MPYIKNRYFAIPDNVWWYAQCWTYDKDSKFKDDGIYLQAHSVFFDYKTRHKTLYIPFTIESYSIKLTQHTTYFK